MSAAGACRCLAVELRAALYSLSNSSPSPTPNVDHPFFRQAIGLVSDLKVHCNEPALLEGKEVGPWTVYRCLLCHTYTHAFYSQGSHQNLLNMSIISSEENITSLKNSDGYSKIFKILVNEINEDPNVKKSSAHFHPSASNLNKRLAKVLQSKLEAIEEDVRLYREKKFLEFEEFREMAHQEYKLISSAISQAEESEMALRGDVKDIMMQEPMINSEYSTPNSKKTTGRNTVTVISKPKNNAVKNLVNIGSFKEDSLDSEGIFDLEGMDSSASPQNGHNSDAYDSDTDDSVSRDEGIHITRDTNQQWRPILAKSLPVTVPVFGHFRDHSQDRLDQEGEETHDIAASMRALARSVHEDVFGDLPRPRFSTQI